MQAVYLDWNATAPLRPEARAALIACLDEVGNPSSVHGFGRRARRHVEQARAAVAELVGARPTEVMFTASGTEANATALNGRARVLVGAGEHASILEAVPTATRIPLNPDGRVDLAALARLLEEGEGTGPPLLSLQLVNNETGVIQPVADAASLVHRRGGLLHCDAAQAAGRMPLSMPDLGIDLLTLSAHKIGGPQGVGALIVREGVAVHPLLRGGGQERRQRAGTENVAGVAGFGAAATAAIQGLGAYAGLAGLRDRMEAMIVAAAPEAVLIGRGSPRVPNTSCLALPGVPAETQLMALDLAGFAVSSGSACSSGKVKASHVLEAMGLPAAVAGSALRISLGWTTTAAEVEGFARAWIAMRDRKAARGAA